MCRRAGGRMIYAAIRCARSDACSTRARVANGGKFKKIKKKIEKKILKKKIKKKIFFRFFSNLWYFQNFQFFQKKNFFSKIFFFEIFFSNFFSNFFPFKISFFHKNLKLFWLYLWTSVASVQSKSSKDFRKFATNYILRS